MIRGGTRQGPVVAVAVALAGCATGASQGNNLRKLPDGSYEVACRQTLATCLQAFETVCAWHGYDVISAAERRQRADLRDPAEETIDSEAQVRCRSGEALFGSSPSAPAPPPPAAAAPSVPAPAPAVPARAAPTAEPPSVAAPPASCLAPPVGGGAAACAGSGSEAPGAVAPR